ncbi:hypothetical protein JRQ81_017265, partial [Phrynocephalus forsythii]
AVPPLKPYNSSDEKGKKGRTERESATRALRPTTRRRRRRRRRRQPGSFVLEQANKNLPAD